MPLRIVHVGLGGWGRDWETNALQRVAGVEVVAWVDADAGALAEARRRLDLPADRCFATLAEAVAAVPAEAVLVTTPLVAHVPVTLEALEAGKHVLVEKPFAPSVAEARCAVEAAEARGLVLMVSQNYRYFPAPFAVRDLIAGGELGQVGAVTVDFRRNATVGSARHHVLAHPLLLDMAIHHFDLMRMILKQEPRSVACQTWSPPWSQFADAPSGAATVTFDGGAVVSWRGSWVSPGPKTNWGGEWRVECEGGEIVWTSRDDRGGPAADRATIRPLRGRPRKVALPEVSPYGRAGAVAAFAEAIAAGVAPATSGRDNLTSLAIAMAAIESAATGRVVEIATTS